MLKALTKPNSHHFETSWEVLFMLPSNQTFQSFRDFAWSLPTETTHKDTQFSRQLWSTQTLWCQRVGLRAVDYPNRGWSCTQLPPISLKLPFKMLSLWTALWRWPWDTSPPSSQVVGFLNEANFPFHKQLSLEFWPFGWQAAELGFWTRLCPITFTFSLDAEYSYLRSFEKEKEFNAFWATINW